MTAHDQIRAMLDELMGTGRDGIFYAILHLFMHFDSIFFFRHFGE